MQIPFSDTTGKTGAVQRFELLTRLPDGEVTGTLLKQVTVLINSGLDKTMPRLLSYSDYVRFDDPNHTDLPIGYVNIVSGQADYKITEDDIEIIADAHSAVIDSVELTKQLLNFSRKKSIAPVAVNIEQTISKFRKL